jgi:ribosomal protein S18 acetylase RimI-like enzyme
MPEEQLRQLLLMQYDAQTRNYAQDFPGASHDVIELDGQPVGRLIVDGQSGQIQCVDISLLPQWRNGGIGTAVMRSLLDECAVQQKSCVLYVLKTNRARNFYDRMGFRVEGDTGTHFLMKWDGSY